MRFSSALDQFYLLPPASTSYPRYSQQLLSIALAHHATLFIPVSGAGSSIEDAQAADEMFTRTKGVCRTFIQDPETMLDLHDKDRFMALVDKLGMEIPGGKMVESVDEAVGFLKKEGNEPKYILKCMGLDENRGDLTLYPLEGDDEGMRETERALKGLRLGISKECPYVFQEFIPGQGEPWWSLCNSSFQASLWYPVPVRVEGTTEVRTKISKPRSKTRPYSFSPGSPLLLPALLPDSLLHPPYSSHLRSLAPQTSRHPSLVHSLTPEWCTHASVLSGTLTSFVACPSNDMLMTYENATPTPLGQSLEQWTQTFLSRLQSDPTPSGKTRRLTGHFSFDFIVSTRNGVVYPIECNARVHTAVIMLPISEIAACYVERNAPSTKKSAEWTGEKPTRQVLRPVQGTLPRSWIYNDFVMRYAPRVLPESLLRALHPSLPACAMTDQHRVGAKPNEQARTVRVDPTLVADDWMPFLVLWHLWWPYMLITRWWQGKKWTRVSRVLVWVSCG